MHLYELGLSTEQLLEFLEKWPLEEGEITVRAGRKEFDARCPVHQDAGRPNWGINLETGFHKCFSCGWSGDFTRLYAEMEKIHIWEALLQLRRAGSSTAGMRRRLEAAARRLRTTVQAQSPKPPAELPAISVYRNTFHPYLETRGITRASARQWDIRYSNKRKSIVIPVRDEEDVTWGYIYRNCDPDCLPKFRYRYSRGFLRTEVLYGFGSWQSRFRGYNGHNLMVVVEGALDCIWVNQAGIPAVAILGSFASEKHLLRMREASEIILMLDKDDSGVATTIQVGEAMMSRRHQVPVRVARYPRYADDPNQVKVEDLHRMVRRAVPYLLWKSTS